MRYSLTDERLRQKVAEEYRQSLTAYSADLTHLDAQAGK